MDYIYQYSRLPKPTKKKVLLLPEDQVFAEKARLYVEGGKQGFGRRVFWIFMVFCVFFHWFSTVFLRVVAKPTGVQGTTVLFRA